MIPGTVLHIYTSQEGTIREKLDTTCITDDQNTCTFTTPHLTLFAVGTILRNNMEFITQEFRHESPTTGQIIDALYGTGSKQTIIGRLSISTILKTRLATMIW